MYMNVPKQLCRNNDCTLNSNEISQLQYEVKLIICVRDVYDYAK